MLGFFLAMFYIAFPNTRPTIKLVKIIEIITLVYWSDTDDAKTIFSTFCDECRKYKMEPHVQFVIIFCRDFSLVEAHSFLFCRDVSLVGAHSDIGILLF
jgi:hypothetical protein